MLVVDHHGSCNSIRVVRASYQEWCLVQDSLAESLSLQAEEFNLEEDGLVLIFKGISAM